MAFLERVQEFFDGPVVERIYRYNLVVGQDDTDGDGDVERITIIEGIILCWRFDDNELYIVFQLITGALVRRLRDEVYISASALGFGLSPS